MRRRDHNILARELRQQLMPRRRSRSWVDVENRGDLRMLQLDLQCMDDVAPKQDLLSLRRKFIAGMSRGMTRQRDELHAVDDWLRATKRVPLTGLDVWRHDGLRTLEERLRILRRLSSDFRRQPKVAFCLRDVNIGIWKDALSVLSGEAADVIGMEVRDQNDVDFFGRVACAAEAARQAPECWSTPPGAGTRIDEDQLLAGVDQEARISNIQHVRIFVQCLENTIHRRRRSVQPVRIEYAGTIEQGRHFEVPDLHPVETRHLIMVLGCSSQSRVRSDNRTGQRRQQGGGEELRISFEHVSTPKVIQLGTIIIAVAMIE